MVKMSLDPVQVMSGQVKELKVAPSANGDSRGSWEEKEVFDQDHLGLTTKPKPVSPAHLYYTSCVRLSLRLLMDHTGIYRQLHVHWEKNPGSPLVCPVTAQFSRWRQVFI